MNTGQNITLGLASVLVVASLWRGQQIQPVWSALTNQQANVALAPYLKNIGLDLAFLIVVVWLAGLSPDAGQMTGALVVGLWLLFLMHPGGASASSKQALVIGNPTTWIPV